MTKIRIIALHLAYGGVEKAIISTANLLAERYEVEIISMYHMPNSPAYELDPKVKVVYLMKDIPNKEAFLTSLEQKKPLKIIKEGCKSIKILYKKRALLKKAAAQIHDGIVITTRNEDTVLFNRYLDQKVYLIAQLHHDHRFDKKLVSDFQKHYGRVDVFALLSQRLCDEVCEMMQGYNTHTKCIVIPNFINDIPAQDIFPQKEHVLLTVGRLHKVKGYDRLIKMAKAICSDTDWKLNIIGDGFEEANLRALAKTEHAEDYVAFLGQKNGDEVEEAMKKASVFLMTSYSEGFPFVLLEAMRAKLPCIAFDVRVGPGALIDHEKNGYLIKDHDSDAFVKACRELMVNQEIRTEMGEAAYEKCRCYTKSAVADLWFRVIEKGI